MFKIPSEQIYYVKKCDPELIHYYLVVENIGNLDYFDVEKLALHFFSSSCQ